MLHAYFAYTGQLLIRAFSANVHYLPVSTNDTTPGPLNSFGIHKQCYNGPKETRAAFDLAGIRLRGPLQKMALELVYVQKPMLQPPEQ
jgi:hypothetical protein